MNYTKIEQITAQISALRTASRGFFGNKIVAQVAKTQWRNSLRPDTLAAVALGFLGFGILAPTIWAVPILQLEVPRAAVANQPGSDSPSAVNFIVVGQISGNRIWLEDAWHEFVPRGNVTLPSSSTPTQPAASPSPNQSPSVPPNPQPNLSVTTNTPSSSMSTTTALPARFAIRSGRDGACAEPRRLREMVYLLKMMADSIARAEVAFARGSEACARAVQNALTASGVSASQDSNGKAETVELMVWFNASPALASSGSALAGQGSNGQVGTTPTPISPTVNTSVPAVKAPGSTPTTAADLVLYVNLRRVQLLKDGWFVAVLESGEAPEVELRQGSESLFRKTAGLMLLKPGFNPGYQNERWQGVDYKITDKYLVATQEIPEESFLNFLKMPFEIKVSVPVYFKVGLGYTSMNPLPAEGARDRLTLLFGARSYPLFERYHIAVDTMASLKSASRVPWTLTTTGLIGTDLIQLTSKWSVPVGIGGRMFVSKIKDQPPDDSGGKLIEIPESVLSPAAQIGAAYRSGLFYSEFDVSVTPVFAEGKDPIITFNPLIGAGYQISAIDIVALNLSNHDVRYPTLRGEAKVVLSSMVLTYQRDFL